MVMSITCKNNLGITDCFLGKRSTPLAVIVMLSPYSSQALWTSRKIHMSPLTTPEVCEASTCDVGKVVAKCTWARLLAPLLRPTFMMESRFFKWVACTARAGNSLSCKGLSAARAGSI